MGKHDARALLERLAGHGAHEDGSDPPPVTEYRETIERATAALENVETAAEFVDDGGLDRLETALEHAEADLSDCASEGREALRAYRAFQKAARGERTESQTLRPGE